MSDNTPLLHDTHGAKARTAPSQPSRRLARGLMAAVGFSRVIFGVSAVIAPQWVMRTAGLPIPPEMALLVRMVAARDFILGELLLTSDDHLSSRLLGQSPGKSEVRDSTREVHRALWFNIATDALDIVWVAVAFSAGQLEGKSAGIAAAAAATVALLGTDALWLYQ